ncbi:hypothetical protein [Parerythrobacter aestuarii]|uniref:hypothetical protein n=1 Tax=Parerythrobacter aestuarii TaxID=3020909 RepID=UPI0024DEAF25|nr:hypothetical protein [Parerythrobacter aestuarii]
MRIIPMLACLALVVPQSLAAQESLPDKDAVELPAITYGDDPQVAKNGYKFFFFHNAEIGFDDALLDFAECRSVLVTGSYLPLPGFVPWVEDNNRKVAQGGNAFGLVGAAISAIILPKLERGLRNNKMRLCMERRGYVRYAMDEAAYDAIWDAEPAKSMIMQATLATNPAPQAPQVTE